MIVSLADMKTRLGIVDASQDTFLTEQLALVQEAVEGYCSRKFEQATYTQTFYWDEFETLDIMVSRIYTYHFPLISIASIKEIWRDSNGTPTETLLASNEYRANFPSGLLKRTNTSGRKSYWFQEGNYELEVQYDAGYSIAEMPKTIRDVIFNLVTERYNKNQSGINFNFGSDVQRIAIPGVMSIDYDYSLETNERKNKFGAILGNQLNVLDPWRSERAVFGEIRETYVG